MPSTRQFIPDQLPSPRRKPNRNTTASQPRNRKPRSHPGTRWVLWGEKAGHSIPEGIPLKICLGTWRQCRAEQTTYAKQGWTDLHILPFIPAPANQPAPTCASPPENLPSPRPPCGHPLHPCRLAGGKTCCEEQAALAVQPSIYYLATRVGSKWHVNARLEMPPETCLAAAQEYVCAIIPRNDNNPIPLPNVLHPFQLTQKNVVCPPNISTIQYDARTLWQYRLDESARFTPNRVLDIVRKAAEAGVTLKLTVRQWQAIFHHDLPFQPNGGIALPIQPTEPGYRDLFNLADYAVDSVIAGTVWLRPTPR